MYVQIKLSQYWKLHELESETESEIRKITFKK